MRNKTLKNKSARLIARLDVKGSHLIKAVHLEGLRVIGDPSEFAQKYYAKSPFTSEEKLKTWLDKKLSQKSLDKDPVYTLSSEFINNYIEKIIMPQRAHEEGFSKGMRLFVDGLNQMGLNKASDANSTMRITFGNVLPYSANGNDFKHYTTLEGVMKKEVKTEDKNHEFYVPKKLKDLYAKKDFGQYANKNGELPVGFLSNNDITGGNSGSPVINAYGELIGTAFDGNWEAMSGDIYFEPNIQRTISVDIRYTLFIIDKYANAGHLIDEMSLITNPKVKTEKIQVVDPKVPLIEKKTITIGGEK